MWEAGDGVGVGGDCEQDVDPARRVRDGDRDVDREGDRGVDPVGDGDCGVDGDGD